MGADLIIPGLAAGLTIYFLVNTAGLVWEARANGTVIGAVLLILVAVQLVRIGLEVRRGRASLGLGSLLERSTVQVQRLGLLVVLTLFIAAIPWVGTTLGLFFALRGLDVASRGSRSAGPSRHLARGGGERLPALYRAASIAAARRADREPARVATPRSGLTARRPFPR